MENELRVLEFYCGIGGVHFALKGISSIPTRVVAAFDINTTTNAIYRHNFPSTKLCQNNIQSLTCKVLDGYEADIWTMSPPCQPFTLKGNRKGEEDRRCDSLKILMTSLSSMINPPRFIFIENVRGFEGTSMHENVMNTLTKFGYSIVEYLLSPIQFGVPNSRPRYYLLASRSMEINRPYEYISIVSETLPQHIQPALPSIDQYISIEDNPSPDIYLSPSIIENSSLNIVDGSSTISSCFTKSYTQYLVGCGSYFRDSNNRIRPFSPREVSLLMSFPSSFIWPQTITNKQVYRALGNSVNVTVVSILLHRLLSS